MIGWRLFDEVGSKGKVPNKKMFGSGDSYESLV